MIHDRPLAPSLAGYFPDIPDPWPKPNGGPIPIRHASSMPKTRGDERPHHNRYGTRTAVDGKKRCPQCWEILPWPDAFGYAGHTRLNCNQCRIRERA